MGYGMARNMREKVGKETTLVVCDLNQEAIDKFIAESSEHGPIEIVKNGFEAIQKAVSRVMCASCGRYSSEPHTDYLRRTLCSL